MNLWDIYYHYHKKREKHMACDNKTFDVIDHAPWPAWEIRDTSARRDDPCFQPLDLEERWVTVGEIPEEREKR